MVLMLTSDWGSAVRNLHAAVPGPSAGLDAYEPDNTYLQASTLSVGVPQLHAFDVDFDEDWAKFTVAPGLVFTLETSSLGPTVDTILTLYDTDGVTELDSNDDSGDVGSLASRLTYTADATGFYFVKVVDFSDSATGPYVLTLTTIADAFETDDTAGQASLLLPGLPQAHTVHQYGDWDWAKFDVVTGRRYIVYTSRLDDTADTVMELYASDGTTLLAEDDDGGGGLASRIVYTATETGFYFVKVNQFADSDTGAYALTLEREPLVYLDGDPKADVFAYDPVSGDWAWRLSNGTGGFADGPGNWSSGWSVLPAEFNGDALSDMFVFNTTTGQWFKMLNDGAGGFTTQATDSWWPGWERYALDLDGDGITDFFLYDSTTGVWFRCLSTPTGFAYEQGGWSPGWEIYPMKFNADPLADMFLIDRATGRWFWVVGGYDGSFTYPVSEAWYPDWVLYPGDFDGDGLTDLLLHDPPTGVYFVAFTTDVGFTYAQGGWSLGWTPHVADLDADGLDDLFLHDSSTGVWFQMISDGLGDFVNVGGETWSLGWDLYPSDFNGDGRADILLYDPVTGVWYQALNLVAGSFSYGGGTWAPGLQIVARPPIR